MGQAQRKRHQDVLYRDVELELWELDDDESGFGSKNSRSRTGSRNRNRTTSGSRQVNRSGKNIRLYDQRQKSTGQSKAGQNRTGRSRVENQIGNQTGSRTNYQRPKRELQVQDIRRYQGNRMENRGNARSAYMGDVRPVQSIKRRRVKRRKVYFARAIAVTFVVLCLVLIYYLTGEIYRLTHSDTDRGSTQTMSERFGNSIDNDSAITPPTIIEDYLEVNDYSRPGTPLNEVNSIFVHYTANPGTSATQNRSYFANLALTQERSASAHFIIGYEGEIVQCIPLEEQAYAVMTRNEDSISIECCYTSEDGSFTPETYDTLVHTLAWLIDKYHLSTDDILRHYDCGGKMCPIYYVENEDAWQHLLQDVVAYEDGGETQ